MGSPTNIYPCQPFPCAPLPPMCHPSPMCLDLLPILLAPEFPAFFQKTGLERSTSFSRFLPSKRGDGSCGRVQSDS